MNTPPELTPVIKYMILRALDTEQYEYGKRSDLDDARRFVESLWQWQQAQKQPAQAQGECTQ
jgi:hypothetical protein